MKKAILTSIAVALMTAVLFGCGASGGNVLVEVNGNEVTDGDLQILADMNPRLKAQMASPIGKKQILDSIVEQEVFYQEAVKHGLNRDAAIKARVEFYRKLIIAQAFLEKEIEAEAKKYYDAHPDEFKKIKFSQILIKFASPEDAKKQKAIKGSQDKQHSEEEALKIANEIKAKLDSGEDFAKLANEYSEDPATKTRGGDVGLISKGDTRVARMGIEPVVDKAYEMKVGEVAGPIKTQKGYYIITLTRGAEVEPFDEAKSSIIAKIRGETRNQLLEKYKKDASIVYPEDEKAKAEKKKADEQKKSDAVKKDGDKPSAEAQPAEGEAKTEASEDKPAEQKPADVTEKPADAKADSETKPTSPEPTAKPAENAPEKK